MSWHIDTLRVRPKKPEMYFGQYAATLTHLRIFFLGLQTRAICRDDFNVLDEFDQWAIWRHGVPNSSTNSFRHILHQANGDEKKAYRLFFEYVEEYLAERKKIGAEGIKVGLEAYLRVKDELISN